MNDPSPTVKRGSRLPLVGAALVLAAILAGTAGALPGRNTVDRDDVQRSAITSKQIKNGQVKPVDLAKPEPWRLVGKPGAPGFFNGGEGDCLWANDPTAAYAPISFRRDAYGRVLLRGVAFAFDAPGGDGRCDDSEPGEMEDGVVFVLPNRYRPEHVSLSTVAFQIAVFPSLVPSEPVPGGSVFTPGVVAVLDDAEFDAAPGGSARPARVPADLAELLRRGAPTER